MAVVAHAQAGALSFGVELVVPLALVAMAARANRRRDAALLAAAAAAVALVVLPPVRPITERSVTGHMLQHLALIVIAAPCVGAALEGSGRTVGGRALARWSGRLVSPVAAPVAAGAAHAVAVALWHLPGPYDAAVHSWVLHGIEHLTMLGTGIWWWASVAHHARRRAAGAAIGSIFLVATAGAGMGVFMMFAPAALYEQGGAADQQAAGALMAGVPGAIFGATAVVLTARAIERAERPRPLRVPVPGGPAVITLLVVLAAALGVVSARDGAAATPAALQDDGDAAVGAEIYRRDCASCHGPDGEGSWRGVPLTDAGSADVFYMLDTGRMPIASPDEPTRRSEPRYSPEEIDAVVAHVVDLVGDPAPLPDVARTGSPGGADVAAGGELYRSQCAACHGATGIGGALAFEGYAPTLHHASRAQVVAATVAGPGAMPTLGGTLSDEQLADVAAYVEVLQEPESTGIAVPGGRVSEGLIAWTLGIGSLVLLARVYGTTR